MINSHSQCEFFYKIDKRTATAMFVGCNAGFLTKSSKAGSRQDRTLSSSDKFRILALKDNISVLPRFVSYNLKNIRTSPRL